MDWACNTCIHQVDVTALCPVIRGWRIAQIPAGATDLDQLPCDGKMGRDVIEPTVAWVAARPFLSKTPVLAAPGAEAACANAAREG